MSRKPTDAMLELWNELRAMGLKDEKMPTARTLENWQAEGLIDTDWKGAGRGRGRTSHYKPRTAEKVVEIVSLLDQRRSFDWVRMALFYRGSDVGFEKLRDSYLRTLAPLPETANLDTEQVHQAARSEASRHVRSGQRQLLRKAKLAGRKRQGLESATDVLASVLRNALTTLSGSAEVPLMREDMTEIAVAHGIPEQVWREVSEEELDTYEDKLDLEWVRDQVATMTESDLVEARDRLVKFLDRMGLTSELEESFAPALPVTLIFDTAELPPEEIR